jgi:hypothetical protein
MKQRQRLLCNLENKRKGQANVLGLVARGSVSMEVAEKQLSSLKGEIDRLQGELSQLDAALADIPTEEAVKCYVERVESSLHLSQVSVVDDDGNEYAGGNTISSFLAMTQADKERLVANVFGARLPDGKPSGVYVSPMPGPIVGGRQRQWQFTIRGLLSFEKVVSDIGTPSVPSRRP